MSEVKVINSDFDKRLSETRGLLNGILKQLLAEQDKIESGLKDAINYVIEAPGKRLRAVLLLWCCELISGRFGRNAEIAAAAIEMVHTYSLVHDDLPAMDDDDLRRGRPTCHKAFNEGTAILVGDGLLTMAFEILAKKIDNPETAVRLIGQLAEAAGASGMIAGQTADLRAENTRGTQELLEYIHTNKTAKLFSCAAVMGGICGGADETQILSLGKYGLKIGLGFQISDDILDVNASSEHLGKTAGKDKKASKMTYPAIMGIEKSRQLEKNLADEAVAVLEPFGREADTLRQLVMVLLERTR